MELRDELFVAGGIAGLTYELWSNLIPVPSDIVLALWTGLIAAVFAAYIQSLRGTQPTEDALVAQAKQDMGTSLWNYAELSAWNHDCDPDLIRAILVTEVMQRPAWFRRLERIKGKIFPAGTYGVGQVAASRPLTDEQSIDAVAESYAGYYPERTENGYVMYERLAARVEQHNRKRAFFDVFRAIYDYLQPTTSWNTSALAHDQRPMIAVSAVDRERDQWVIAGTAIAYEANLIYASEGGELADTGGFVQVSTAGPRRGTWQIRLPLDTRRVRLWDENPDDTADVADQSRTAVVDVVGL